MGVVTIHVIDSDGSKKDYHCEAKLLLSHMAQLQPLLQHVPGQDMALSVNCSIVTFDFLMGWVKAAGGVSCLMPVPVLDCSNCIAVLVAAAFLKMSQLTGEAVAFIASNITALAATTAAHHIAALDSVLLTKIAKATAEEALEQLWQQGGQQQAQLPLQHSPSPLPRCQPAAAAAAATNTSSAPCSSFYQAGSELLLEKLYKHKLQALLKQHQTTLLRCCACHQVFSAAGHKKLQCPAIAGAARERLRQLPLHQPDDSWSFQAFLQQQRHPKQQQQQQQQQQTWRQLYFFTLGHVALLYCQHCHQHFPARQYMHCSHHPEAPLFESDAAAGVHPCCGRPSWAPGMSLAECQGCAAGQHQAALAPPRSPSPDHQRDQQQQQQQQAGIATQQQPESEEQQMAAGPDEHCQDSAARVLQLLERLGSLILEPYEPPPPPHQLAASAERQFMASSAAAATGASRSGSTSSGGTPLLVKMARLGASAGHNNSNNNSNNNSSSSYSQRAIAGLLGASCAAAAAGAQRSNSSRGSSAGNSGDAEGEDELAAGMAARTNHLSGFLNAVRDAAQSTRCGEMRGAQLQTEVSFVSMIPLGHTFSEGGTRRLLPAPRQPSALRNPAGRPALAMSGTSGAGGPSRPAVASLSTNRTLLLEMMHEEDVFRMNLLMRKLDSMRLQPLPDPQC